MTSMSNFLTWDVLLTFSGCIAVTVILTEWLKKLLPKLPSQLASFVISFVILVIGHLATGTFAWGELPLNLINAVAVSLSANGGFDILQKAFGKKTVEGNNGMLVVDETGDAPLIYLQPENDPKTYTDGQKLVFKVTKTSQE